RSFARSDSSVTPSGGPPGNREPFPCVQRAPRADGESAQPSPGGCTMKAVVLLALASAVFDPLSVWADDSLVKVEGGIGVQPVSNVAGTANADGTFPNVTRNIVRGVNPAGQIWVIADLRANVKADGSIKVDGRGLLLAGGNSIGGNANASVFATL